MALFTLAVDDCPDTAVVMLKLLPVQTAICFMIHSVHKNLPPVSDTLPPHVQAPGIEDVRGSALTLALDAPEFL